MNKKDLNTKEKDISIKKKDISIKKKIKKNKSYILIKENGDFEKIPELSNKSKQGLEMMQKLVKGYIEYITPEILKFRVGVITNEEGSYRMKPNLLATNFLIKEQYHDEVILYGPVLVEISKIPGDIEKMLKELKEELS